MWGIKLKGFIRQADLSYSQRYDDDGEEDKDNYFQDDNDKGGMNDKDNLLYNKYIMRGNHTASYLSCSPRQLNVNVYLVGTVSIAWSLSIWYKCGNKIFLVSTTRNILHTVVT